MRVAVTNDVFIKGGAVGPMSLRFVEALRDAGHDATLITGCSEDKLPNHIPVIDWEYPQRTPGVMGAHRFLKQLLERSAKAFRRWREVGEGDAWIALVAPSAYGSMRGGAKEVPLLYICNSPWAMEWRMAWETANGTAPRAIRRLLEEIPRRRIEHKVVNHASALASLSSVQTQWFVSEHPKLARKPRFTIPAAVNTSKFGVLQKQEREVVRQRAEIPAGATMLICSRRLVPRTGVDLLIQALALLSDIEITLIVTGDGDQASALRKLAKDQGVSESIRFTGVLPIEELRMLTAAADFAVLPTRGLEGFGLSAAEAFSAGTPVIATPVGALPEVVGEFDKRLLADRSDAQALAETLRRVLFESEFRREAYRRRCREYAVGSFDWDTRKHLYVELAEAVANREVKAFRQRQPDTVARDS